MTISDGRWAFILLLILILSGCGGLKSTTSHYTNTLGMKLIKIPAGKFIMGSPPEEEGRFESEGPVHQVYLDEYYIAEKEVTVGHWKKFAKETSSPWDKWVLLETYALGDAYPILFVTWDDAKAFCTWLSGKEGKTYRLPTEAEWEKAARGGMQGKKYPWGDALPDGTQCNFADKNTEFPWSDKNSDDGYAFTAPVGSFPPNAYGLYDMAGNAWEWCEDWFEWNYYQYSPKKNPKGSDSGIDRVMRGGSWCNDASLIRCAFRGTIFPDVPNHPRGFRVVMEP
jgi:formylglycine-generating enzyme required for sulfatase activity